MTNANGRLRVKDQRLTLEDFTVTTLGGQIGVTGFYETTVPAKPTFDLGLRIERLDIPSAFETLTTVRQLAPIARYARENFSSDLQLSGVLGKDMAEIRAEARTLAETVKRESYQAADSLMARSGNLIARAAAEAAAGRLCRRQVGPSHPRGGPARRRARGRGSEERERV